MGDRYFRNEMPDYIPESPTLQSSSSSSSSDSLTELLHKPYKTLSELLVKSASDIKDKVVKETWVAKRKRVSDYSLYTGALGTAFLLFKAYQVSGNKDDLALCFDIIEACDSAASAAGFGRVTFICGEAGVYTLGAVVSHHKGDDRSCHRYITKFKQIKLPMDLPDELLYGRAGYLWAALFLNKNMGEETISSTRMRVVVDDIIESGQQLGKGSCPLMFQWHGKEYWGAAHGLAGIINVLMDMELKTDEVECVKGTLRYMIRNRFPSGNYPSSEGSESDRLVHWCHGAPGVALTLVKAAKVFKSEEFLQAAINASELVWSRGLLKRVGLCHGISGNTYVFLSLYQLTGKPEFLHRAKAFATFLHDHAQTLISEGIMHGGDHPYSLFEGIGGMAYLLFDMAEPSQARFPGYQL